MLSAMIIPVLVYATFVAMAKARGRGRRSMGRYLRGTIDEELSLSTLASLTLVEAAFDEVVNERTLVSSISAIWTMSNYTPVANAGPILVGVCHSDYSQSEIEAFIETTGSWNEGDLTQREVANRKIRRIGIFDTPDAATDSAVLNEGRALKTKLNWILLQGQTLRLWAYNLGTAALTTTSPTIRMAGHANLWAR